MPSTICVVVYLVQSNELVWCTLEARSTQRVPSTVVTNESEVKVSVDVARKKVQDHHKVEREVMKDENVPTVQQSFRSGQCLSFYIPVDR